MANITGIGGFFSRSNDPGPTVFEPVAQVHDPEGNAIELWEPAKQ